MCSRWACLAGLCRSNHLSCCEFRHLLFFNLQYSNVLFTLRHTFQKFIVLIVLLGHVGLFLRYSWLTFFSFFLDKPISFMYA